MLTRVKWSRKKLEANPCHVAMIVECGSPEQPPCSTFQIQGLRYQVSWYVVLVMCQPQGFAFSSPTVPSRPTQHPRLTYSYMTTRQKERERERERESCFLLKICCWWKLGGNSGKHGNWLAFPSWLESSVAVRDIKTLYYGREGLPLWRY